MALSEAERRKCVETLLNAEKEKKQAVQLSVTFPHITIEDAYAISTAVAQHKIKGGAKLIGHKVGLTSKAMQASSQINEPDYGHLLDYMMIADGAKVPHANFCVPRVEVELAFILGKPLKGPGVGLTDVLRATEYVVPAIEIVDDRYVDWQTLGAPTLVADDFFAAGCVLGKPVARVGVPDVLHVSGRALINGVEVGRGSGTDVLGHPHNALAWLANHLAADGKSLRAGQLVLTGSLVKTVWLNAGDEVAMELHGLGTVEARFS